MTAQPVETPVVETPPVQVKPPARSRLAQLHERYAEAKAAADAAQETLKAITDAIKLELTAADPDARRFELVAGGAKSTAPSLNLTYVESWRIDSRKLKAENPETYVRYAKKSGSWRLAPAKSGGEDS